MVRFFSTLLLISAVFCTVICDDGSSDDIEQLCGSDNDLSCVRKYFSQNGRCSEIKNGNDRAYYKANLPVYAPNIDLCVVTSETQLSQLDGDITHFYLNKLNDEIVMTVDFSSKGIICAGDDSYFAVSQNGREPKVVADYVNATYPVILTAVISVSNGLSAESLKNASYFSVFPTSDVPIQIGPKFSQSDDPVIKKAAAGLVANISLALSELFVTEGPYLFLAYLENNICDFGLMPAIQNYDVTVLQNARHVDVNDKSQFSEPCSQSDDLENCVRKYFNDHGSCDVVQDADDEPVLRGKFVDEIPLINTTVHLLETVITGLNGKIKEIYKDEKSNNLVMSVDFDQIYTNTTRGILKVHEIGAEPKSFSSWSVVKYPVTLTASIPLNDGLSAEAVKKSFVTSYLRETPGILLGPGYSQSEDPQMLEASRIIQDEPSLIAKQILVTEGTNLFMIYLQKYICDFSIDTSTNVPSISLNS